MGRSERRLPDLVARVKLRTNDLDMLPKEAQKAGAALRMGLGVGAEGADKLTHQLEGATLELKRVGAGGHSAGQKVHAGAKEAERGLLNLEHAAELVKVRLGEVGTKGAELKGVLNLGGGSLGGGLVLTATIGGIAVVLEKATEQAEKHEKAELSLEQAFDSQGKKFDEVKPKLEAWLKAHERSIPDVNQAREGVAAFVRAGYDYPKAIEAMNTAVNLAALKHVDLATAQKAVLLGMMGNGKALKELGIDLKELKNSDENTTKAISEYNAATTEVNKTTKAHDQAVQHLADTQNELKGKTNLSVAEQIKLRDAQAKADSSAKDLNDALEKQKDAQGALGESMKLSDQVLGALNATTKDGAGALTKMQQAQYKANAEWDRFANELGPPALEMERRLLDIATDIYSGFEAFGKDDSWWRGLNDGLVTLVRAAGDLASGLEHAAMAAYDLTRFNFRGVVDEVGQIGAALGRLGGKDNPFDAIDDLIGLTGGAIKGGVDRAGNNLNTLFTGGGRADGGPVLPNQVYTVGERGRETLVMGRQGGYVVPQGGQYAPSAPASATGGQALELHQRMDVPIFLDGAQIGYAVQSQVRRELARVRG